jgi:hypothetical protein
MEEPKDFVTWLQVAKVCFRNFRGVRERRIKIGFFIFLLILLFPFQCFKIWDLDARGYHKSMWRMRMKGSEMLVIGVPNSEYA